MMTGNCGCVGKSRLDDNKHTRRARSGTGDTPRCSGRRKDNDIIIDS